jgi:NADH-quinone oxidoreductase subunit N
MLVLFDLLAFSPEVFLFFSSIIALVTGLFVKRATIPYFILFIAFSLAAILLEWGNFDSGYNFNSSLIRNDLSYFFRCLILFTAFITLIIFSKSSLPYEVPILMTITSLALMLLVSSNDFLTLYLTMELAGLSLYIMVASRRGSLLGSEAAIKYLILAAFSSAFFLMGVAFWGTFQGTFSFNFSKVFFDFQPLVQISILMILISIFFKLGVAPLHLWLADLYQGAPWQVVIFLGTLAKIAFFGIFLRFMNLFEHLFNFQQLLEILGIISIILGGLAAIRQDDLKRIIAYSSVNNLGLVFIVMSLKDTYSLAAALFYFLIYNLLLFLPTFIMVGNLSNPSGKLPLASLSLARNNKAVTLFFLNLMLLALAGLPPFAGFFGKLYLLITLIENKAWYQLFFFLLGAIFSVIYSIKIIKASYFEKGNLVINKGPYPLPSRESLIFIFFGLINLSLIFFSSNFINWLIRVIN